MEHPATLQDSGAVAASRALPVNCELHFAYRVTKTDVKNIPVPREVDIDPGDHVYPCSPSPGCLMHHGKAIDDYSIYSWKVETRDDGRLEKQLLCSICEPPTGLDCDCLD